MSPVSLKKSPSGRLFYDGKIYSASSRFTLKRIMRP